MKNKLAHSACYGFILTLFYTNCCAYEDTPCKWKSNTGSHYDLQRLTVVDPSSPSYLLEDGDIPCTPETEPKYNFVFNFCADVTAASYPNSVCDNGIIRKTGAAIQYLNRSDGYKECEVIGHYDSSRDDTYFSLINPNDPSKGVSLKYTYGDKCPSGALRSATIQVQCSNTKVTVISALELTKCEYTIVIKSMYGCPTQCPITPNGLCNSHGFCAFDPKLHQSRCYCNAGGFGGEACLKGAADTSSSSSGEGTVEESAAYQVELGLLIVLVIVLVVLVAFVGFMVYKVAEFRKLQATMPLSSTGYDMVGSELTDQHF